MRAISVNRGRTQVGLIQRHRTRKRKSPSSTSGLGYQEMYCATIPSADCDPVGIQVPVRTESSGHGMNTGPPQPPNRKGGHGGPPLPEMSRFLEAGYASALQRPAINLYYRLVRQGWHAGCIGPCHANLPLPHRLRSHL